MNQTPDVTHLTMWRSRNKIDLMIEVWEKLDCESVGAAEIEAIEEAVTGRFGQRAVDSPMVIARLLADEGAELRHSEIMELYVKRRSEQRPYEAELRDLLDLESLKSTLRSIRDAENLRRKLLTENDKEGLRLLREKVIAAKERLSQGSGDKMLRSEITHWLTLWLQSPELFENWLKIRRGSKGFIDRFGKV